MFARLLLTTVLSATLALAQGQKGGGGGGMGDMGGGGGMGGGMPRAQRASRFDQIADKLKLNKDQKEQAQTIMDAAREEATPLRESLAKARLGIADALINAKGDDDVKKAQEAYAAEVAKMTGVEAKAFGKIYALLKPNQQSKASQAWDLMADMFSFERTRRGRRTAPRPEPGPRGTDKEIRMTLRILSTLFLAAGLVMAQGGGGGGKGGNRGGGAPMSEMGMQRPEPLDQFAQLLKLNKDQKKDFKGIMDETQKEANSPARRVWPRAASRSPPPSRPARPGRNRSGGQKLLRHWRPR